MNKKIIQQNLAKKPIAHIKNNGIEIQFLITHLENTHKLCFEFCSKFGLEKLGSIIGLTHDIGKASKAFQNKIQNSVLNDDVNNNPRVDHSTAGAQFLYEKYSNFGLILAYIVAGHHGGLPNGIDDSNTNLNKRLKKEIEDYKSIVDWLDNRLPGKIEAMDFLTKNAKKITNLYLVIKMLYSALTDADFLDTEAFMTPGNAEKRRYEIKIEQLEKHFFNYIENMQRKTQQTPINIERKKILDWSLQAAELDPGIFSLTVPTGGGKTLSSMAFALKHAVKYHKNRIIYVIPYTTIIEQNAQVFHNIFRNLSPDIVLEHHSSIDIEKETTFNRLASQNWNAPIIVTTNVQFFESFYNNRSSANRKLHNIANSVIIFDEAQMFPPEFLEPSLVIINELVTNFGCSAVICTATQPILHRDDLLKEYLQDIHEIIADTKKLYSKFRRVKTYYIKEEQTLEMIAEKLIEYKQVLTIVNTRKDARILAETVATQSEPTNVFHLSTLMVPHHRKTVLNTIKERLKKNKTCILASTQLIEAGVDIDFPVVYRAVAGLDSIAQAAGRCNREGNLSFGEIYIFNTERKPPPGYLRRSADSGKNILNQFKNDILNQEAIEKYFEDFWGKEKYEHKFDKKNIIELCKKQPNAIEFKKISGLFKIISHKSYSLIIPYDEMGQNLVNELENYRYSFVPRELRKMLYQYTIQLREREFVNMANVIENVFGDGEFFVLRNLDIYDNFVGLKPENPEFLEIESTII